MEDRTAAAGNYVAEATRRGGESRGRDSFLINRKVFLLNKTAPRGSHCGEGKNERRIVMAKDKN